MWLRSGGEHSAPELKGEVRFVQRLFGSSGEHCDLELAVEVRRRKEKEGLRGRQADKNPNNLHLRGDRKTYIYIHKYTVEWILIAVPIPK